MRVNARVLPAFKRDMTGPTQAHFWSYDPGASGGRNEAEIARAFFDRMKVR
jgi:hypothetical protein